MKYSERKERFLSNKSGLHVIMETLVIHWLLPGIAQAVRKAYKAGLEEGVAMKKAMDKRNYHDISDPDTLSIIYSKSEGWEE
jgi:hypothetical protein